jgi:signal transduction histidine kinase
LASYLLITVLALALLEVPLAVFFAQRERERIAADLEHDATVIATLYEDDLESDRPLDPQPATAYNARTDARVVVVDRDGISLVDTAGPIDRDFSTRPEMARALSGRLATGTRSSDTLATDILYVAMPVASGGTVHGALRVTIDTSDVSARIHRFWVGLGAVAIVIIGVVALVGWWLASSVTRPVRRLQADADRFAGGDLTVEPGPAGGPPELRALADSIATMATRLDELLAAQRRFVADASHQLRSPLTALKLRLENLHSRLPPAATTELDAAVEETDRLGALVNDLLQLTRADERPRRAAVDLARLSADRVDTWTALAEARQVELRTAGLDLPAVVQAVPGAIEQILDNLLDNALNASPPGSTITAAVTSGPHEHRLHISDEGAGLRDEQKALATRRFWRASASGDGTGLGLAIVDALAAASGGSLELTDAPGGGLTVTVSLPAAAESVGVRHASARGRPGRPSG